MTVQPGPARPGGPTPTVELTPPDISPYRAGNTGIPYVTTFDSGQAGPHVLICALTHGNEISGAIALDHLLRHEVRPVAGRLSVAFMNTNAYSQFDPTRPHASRYIDEDFNRLWNPTILEAPEPSIERRRARELRPLIDDVDLLLDLHSMQSGHRPILLSGPADKGRAFARRVGGNITIVSDMGHGRGTRMRDYGCFNTPTAPHNALLAECGPHWKTVTAETAIETVYRFLDVTGVVSPGALPVEIPDAPRQASWVEVTGRFVPETGVAQFARVFENLENVPEAGTIIAYDGPRDIRTPYDDCILVMPARRLVAGQTAVRLGRLRSFDDDVC